MLHDLAAHQHQLRADRGPHLALGVISALRRPSTLGAVGLWLFWQQAANCISYPNFPDVDIGMLGAKVIAAGGRLYRDFVDSLGLLQFMLAELSGVRPVA